MPAHPYLLATKIISLIKFLYIAGYTYIAIYSYMHEIVPQYNYQFTQ